MEKLFYSRTFWTVVLMFIIGGLNAIANFVPPEVQTALMGILTMAAMYFKLNPSQKY